ncbi:MAG: SH3 domain-containing protein [Desulfobacteraceae bacterium]|nr:SH3 domain-containing protein [Desulfobacteraceae bacterium]
MTILSPFCRLRGSGRMVLAISACIMVSCAQQPPQQPPQLPPQLPPKKTEVTAEAEAKHAARYAKLESRLKKVQKTLPKRDADLRAIKDKNAKLKFRLLEKETQIKELEKRVDSQQIMLDEAILEVVRTKAKLRSLESRAEAASNMAEAEIAMRALKEQLGGGEQDPEVTKAEELLKMSALEFKKENYGGALYLTRQAKSHIKAGKMKLGIREEKSAVQGEVVFAQPLPLQVLRMSNLREKPDNKSKVLTTLEKGMPVVGYSYMGEWVRVKSEDGISGWIFQTLVGGR